MKGRRVSPRCSSDMAVGCGLSCGCGCGAILAMGVVWPVPKDLAWPVPGLSCGCGCGLREELKLGCALRRAQMWASLGWSVAIGWQKPDIAP